MTPLKSVIFFLILWTKCDQILLANSSTDNITQIEMDKVKRYLYDYGYLKTDDESSLQAVNESDLSLIHI